MSGFQQGATYEQIQNWVQEKYGFHVTHLNIAKTKRKCGITERINYKLCSGRYGRAGCDECRKQGYIRRGMKNENTILLFWAGCGCDFAVWEQKRSKEEVQETIIAFAPPLRAIDRQSKQGKPDISRSPVRRRVPVRFSHRPSVRDDAQDMPGRRAQPPPQSSDPIHVRKMYTFPC